MSSKGLDYLMPPAGLVLLGITLVISEALGPEPNAVSHFAEDLIVVLLLMLTATRFGLSFAVRFFVVFYFVAFMADFLGQKTGIFYYPSTVQPQILGVPVEVTLVWTGLALLGYSLGYGRYSSNSLKLIPIAFFLMVSWGMLNDPWYVANNFWVWRPTNQLVVVFFDVIGWSLSMLGLGLILGLGKPYEKRRVGMNALTVLYLCFIAFGLMNDATFGLFLRGVTGASLMVLALVTANPPRFKAIFE